ncbi:hypothetical protein [Meiothermus cerbereus]|uniref:hypothetical protein n=1 Tax=Meiothermus cerbereus TaxID=65552 RepID=UPI003EE96448
MKIKTRNRFGFTPRSGGIVLVTGRGEGIPTKRRRRKAKKNLQSKLMQPSPSPEKTPAEPQNGKKAKLKGLKMEVIQALTQRAELRANRTKRRRVSVGIRVNVDKIAKQKKKKR